MSDSSSDDKSLSKRDRFYEDDGTPSDLFSPTFANPGDTIQAPNIPFDTLIFGSKLGSGTFGSVYKGSVRGVVVAIKVLKATSVNIEDLLQEVGIMSHLRFSNIVTMHGVCFHEDHLYIISEYLPCGDLEHWLSDKNKEINYITKLKILKDVAMAMNWLHSSDPPVIHRDLKPANVLLTTSRRPGDEETIIKENRIKEIEKDLMAKVTDMGLSKVLNTNQQLKADGAGSNLWMAPELLKYQFYDEKVDCYSFALLIWQVLTWTRNPFQDYLDRGDLDVFVEAVYYRKVRPAIPSNLKVHPKLLQLMNAGWAHTTKDRPDFSEFAMGLDDCLISTLFKDEEYAHFWKQNWGAQVIHQERRVQPAKEVIPWNIFVQGLYDYLKPYGLVFPENPENDVYYLCLKAIVIDPKIDAVTIERLLLVEKWFGPLIQVTNTPVVIMPALPTPSIDNNLKLSIPRALSTPSNPSHLLSPSKIQNTPKLESSQQPHSPKTSSRRSVKESRSKDGKYKPGHESKSKLKKDSEKQKVMDKSGKRNKMAHENTGEERSPRKEKSPRKEDDISHQSPKRRTRTHSQVAKKEKEEHIGSRTKTRSSSAAPSPHPESVARSKSPHSKAYTAGRQRTLNIKPKSSKSTERPEEKTLLGAIKRILEQTWFHGDISKEDADSSLATNKTIEGPKIFGSHGDFLVRLSLSEPVEKHPFTISKVNKKGVIFHQRIFYKEEESRYVVFTKADSIPEVSAVNIIQLIKLLTELKIVNQPCKRWNYARKYADIFEKKQSQDGGYLDIDDLPNK